MMSFRWLPWICVCVLVTVHVRVSESRNGIPWPRPVKLKIFGGSDAALGQFPFQIMLLRDDAFICGGSIINEWTVMTAAHCIGTPQPSAGTFSIIAGERKLSVYEGTEQHIGASAVIVHEAFSPDWLKNDIAILHLEKPLNFNTNVGPVKLSDMNFDDRAADSHSQCTTSGWGSTDPNTYPDDLMWVNVTVVRNGRCNRRLFLNGLPLVSHSSVCTIDTRKGACSGDSGGPIGCYDSGLYRQVGITSWGPVNCNVPPNVFTRVSWYQTWIADNTKHAAACVCYPRHAPNLSSGDTGVFRHSTHLWLITYIYSFANQGSRLRNF